MWSALQTSAAVWADILYQRLRLALGKTDALSSTEKRLIVTEMSKKALRCHDSDLAAAAYLHVAVYVLWESYVATRKFSDFPALLTVISRQFTFFVTICVTSDLGKV